MSIKAVVFDAYGTLYDTQSVAEVTEQTFPGHSEMITQVWRLKQLEYTWLRSLMGQYEDFSEVTRSSLRYTLRLLGLQFTPAIFELIMDKYVHLELFPDALATLESLSGTRLAILSNGSPSMLSDLVANTGLSLLLEAVISVDEVRKFKPSPATYSLVEQYLGLPPQNVLFVSSNPFDVCGAKSFGFNVAWIERVTPETMAEACAPSGAIGPLTMFRAIRQQMDELGFLPDHRLSALSDLPGVVRRLN